MTRVLGPSSLTFSLWKRKAQLELFLSLLVMGNLAHGQVPSAKRATKAPLQSAASHSLSISELDFLQRAEEIEREAWWVLTEKRFEPAGSPFRVFRVALLQNNPQFKTKLNLRFCRRLQVVKTASNMWRVDSLCQKPIREVGILHKSAPRTWKLQWKMSQFENHFGLGATLFYPQLSCEIDLNDQGRIEIMRCPLYARNRNEDEIVELNTFLYTAKGKALIKLKGEIKKDLQVVGTIETEVPLTGDVVVKEKRIPQKPVEGETDFSNTEVSQKPAGIKGGHGHEGKGEGEKKPELAGQENQKPQQQTNSPGPHQEPYQEGSPAVGIQGPQDFHGQPQFAPPVRPPEYGPPVGEEGGYPLYAPPVPAETYYPDQYPDENAYPGPPLIVEPIRIGPPPIAPEGGQRD